MSCKTPIDPRYLTYCGCCKQLTNVSIELAELPSWITACGHVTASVCFCLKTHTKPKEAAFMLSYVEFVPKLTLGSRIAVYRYKRAAYTRIRKYFQEVVCYLL